ncbi:MAG: hypothetical protein ACSLE0_23015, partial [Chitinophagaceae bacterium]
IADLLLERENPPRLSKVQKAYYYLRPYIPLRLRQYMQSKRQIEVPERWYITDRLIKEYLNHTDSETFRKRRETIWPHGNRAALVLTHDVETEEGFDFIPKVIEVERKYGFVSSWNIVPHLYPIKKEILDLIRESNHEIGIHDYNHDGKLFFSRKIFNRRKLHINEAIKKFHAVGFRSGAVHRNLDWQQDFDVLYEASTFDIDPFQPMKGGTHSIWPFQAGRFIELPYTLPQDHVLWIQLQQKDNSIWEEKTNWLCENNGLILSITHPDYIMMNDNFRKYEDLLIFFKSCKKLWHVLPAELARFWKENYT